MLEFFGAVSQEEADLLACSVNKKKCVAEGDPVRIEAQAFVPGVSLTPIEVNQGGFF